MGKSGHFRGDPDVDPCVTSDREAAGLRSGARLTAFPVVASLDPVHGSIDPTNSTLLSSDSSCRESSSSISSTSESSSSSSPSVRRQSSCRSGASGQALVRSCDWEDCCAITSVSIGPGTWDRKEKGWSGRESVERIEGADDEQETHTDSCLSSHKEHPCNSYTLSAQVKCTNDKVWGPSLLLLGLRDTIYSFDVWLTTQSFRSASWVQAAKTHQLL